MKKYQITLHETQLRLIAECLEDCSRFMAGQTDMANCTSRLQNMREVRDQLKELHRTVVPELGHGSSYPWNGLGCPNKAQRIFIAGSYYLYREMRHADVVSRGIDNVYSSPTLRCADSGEPIEIKEV